MATAFVVGGKALMLQDAPRRGRPADAFSQWRDAQALALANGDRYCTLPILRMARTKGQGGYFNPAFQGELR
jgi:hypothetical protein